MRHCLSHLLVFSAFVVCVSPARSADKKTVYELPKDPKAVVISFDWKGGFTPPRKKMDPALSILRDGTVLMPDRFGLGKDASGKISQKELQSLLRFAIEENKFFQFDAAAVKDKVRKANKGRPAIVIADAPSSVLEIRLAKKSHKASYYALTFAANRNKTIAELQQLAAIQKRLTRLMNVVRLGGKDELNKKLALANRELKKAYPKARPLTDDHLQSVGDRPGGSRYISFYRAGKTATGKPDGTYTTVTIQVPAKGDPKVTVRAKLK